MNNELRENIKILLLKKHLTMTELASKMTTFLGKRITQSNLLQKLGNKSLRYDELMAICEILDYEIKLETKK